MTAPAPPRAARVAYAHGLLALSLVLLPFALRDRPSQAGQSFLLALLQAGLAASAGAMGFAARLRSEDPSLRRRLLALTVVAGLACLAGLALAALYFLAMLFGGRAG